MDLVAHLRVFVAVAEHGSFTVGAQACAVPQPVASRRVAALERHLQGVLLSRSSRRVELTDLGRAVLPHAVDLVARAEHLHALARAHGASVVVGLPAWSDPQALVGLRRRARELGLTLSYSEQPPSVRAGLLRSGSLDLAPLPVAPDEEQVGAELGAATAEPGPGAHGSAHGPPVLRGRRVHVDQLRRAAGDRARARVIHLEVEDDVPWVRDPLRRAAREAGLADGQVVAGSPASEALSSALEHGDVVVATRAWASAHGLRWRPWGGLRLRRSYALAGGRRVEPVHVAALLPGLATALGLEPVPTGESS